MSQFAGVFVWHELKTTDAAAATAFYTAAVGWQAKASAVPGIEYTRLMADGRPCAGLMAMPPPLLAAGERTGWTGYIGVESVDDTLPRLTAAGGTLCFPPMDIPGVGRVAAVTDPQGAAFALFQPASAGEGPPPPGMPGTAGWNELRAADDAAAFSFYAEMFGWEKGDTIDMGDMGNYQLFTSNGVAMGGIMRRPDPATTPAWHYYFNVHEIHAAEARVKAAGGQVVQGPHPVPGGSWIILCVDPQGGTFALVAPP